MTCKLLLEEIYATGFVEKISDQGARRQSVCSDLVTNSMTLCNLTAQ